MLKTRTIRRERVRTHGNRLARRRRGRRDESGENRLEMLSAIYRRKDILKILGAIL